MKQLLILSGKGGTGKTTVAAAFIKLSGAKAYADCDVDAPNLHLLMNRSDKADCSDYIGMPKAAINPEKCVACDLCRQFCRFEAIEAGDVYRIDRFACEGCGVCTLVCPAQAITMEPAKSGDLMLFRGDTVFSTAQLQMGSGNSGKLVSEVKKRLLSAAPGAPFAVLDGSPGIGCPVIASVSGTDMVLIVAEPSVSGISDMERVLKTVRIFGIKAAVCVNKYDTNPAMTEQIERFCAQNNLPFTGKIPFDPEAVKAVNRSLTIADVDCAAGRAVKDVYTNTIAILFEESGAAAQ